MMPTENESVIGSWVPKNTDQDAATQGWNPSNSQSTFPTTLADLKLQSSLDPASNTNIYKTISLLRKATLGIPNRLLSILQDADFVRALYDHLNQQAQPNDQGTSRIDSCNAEDRSGTWPLIPNERSGSWPLRLQLKVDSQRTHLSPSKEGSQSHPVSAYFKSTDGHVNQWSFSTRRLNLPVLEILGSAGGSVLIDTTRRGKAYPDALRRTVPVFVSTWNYALFGDLVRSGVCGFQGFGLERGEVHQIESRLPAFVQDLKDLGLDLGEIKRKLRKPIRCIWISQPAAREQWDATFDDVIQQVKNERMRWKHIGGVNILVCCSASRRVLGAEMSDEGYIQGAGDDSEGWSQGLTAKMFWENEVELVRAVHDGGDTEDLVRTLVQRDKENRDFGVISMIKPTQNLFLSAGKPSIQDFQLVIDCNHTSEKDNVQLLGLGCKEGKLGSKMLRDRWPTVRDLVSQVLRKTPKARILVRCSTGKDLSVGVALMILCCFYSDGGAVQFDNNRTIDKQFIRQRLAWITSSQPDANPSRATLQAVNWSLVNSHP